MHRPHDSVGGLQAYGCRGSQLYSLLRDNDRNAVLVWTGTGPQYWIRDMVDGSAVHEFGGGHYFTRCFANEYVRHLLLAGGIISRALRNMATELRMSGCEVIQLIEHRNTQWLRDLTQQLVHSTAFQMLIDDMKLKFEGNGEYVAISIDATYKIALKVLASF